MPAELNPRYEVIRGFNDGVFAELWDKRLAPAGLAFLLRQSGDGLISLTGFDVEVPVDVFQQFLDEALLYVVQDPKALSERWHSCECGCELDRDHNAAINIKHLWLGRSHQEAQAS